MQNVCYHGRFAPSPTGGLHVGSARTALVAWCAARRSNGLFTIRVEDLDEPRTVPGMQDAQLNDLEWLRIDWDAGPKIGGPHGLYIQSLRHEHYQAALDQLYRQETLFPCKLSRKDLRELASAPHGRQSPYPRSLRPAHVQPGWYTEPHNDAAIRLKVPNGRIAFYDQVCGTHEENVAVEVGDYVLKRKDGVFAYQLAVVVDDLHMGITEVVRGQDLLESTARQLHLIDTLGGERPSYAHLPLVLNAQGDKLSKRDASLSLATLRERGISAKCLVGYLAWTIGLLPEARPVSPGELVDHFDWSLIQGRQHWIVPEDLIEMLSSSVTLRRCSAT